jgi:hypothetical protein
MLKWSISQHFQPMLNYRVVILLSLGSQTLPNQEPNEVPKENDVFA